METKLTQPHRASCWLASQEVARYGCEHVRRVRRAPEQIEMGLGYFRLSACSQELPRPLLKERRSQFQNSTAIFDCERLKCSADVRKGRRCRITTKSLSRSGPQPACGGSSHEVPNNRAQEAEVPQWVACFSFGPRQLSGVKHTTRPILELKRA